MPGSLEYELQRSLRHTRYFSLLVARPDRLTGAQARDEQALAEVATTMLEQLRGTDAVSRRGAADFWVILPETPSDAARVVGERVRLALGSTGEGISVSIGISAFPDDGLAARDLAVAAEKALRRAIELGGSRTVMHSSRSAAPAGWSVVAGPDRVA
jgi:diguanylate cyclase (GGDEF)-like protein